MSKCIRCGINTNQKCKGKPLCYDCRLAFKKDKAKIFKLGAMSLPGISFRSVASQVKSKIFNKKGA